MYQSPTRTFWKGRQNAEDGPDGYLFHHIIKFLDLSGDIPKVNGNHIAFLGFSCEEGVRRNFGRLGAKEAPDAIRLALAKMAVHFDDEALSVYDAGQVICKGDELESAQERLAEKLSLLLYNGYFPILLGGGHEIAYGHYQGLRRAIPDSKKIGIINIDAHFDFRSYESGPSSGTPFRQIYDDCISRNESFHYLPIGISEAGNTKSLFHAIQQAGVSYILRRDLMAVNLKESIQEFSEKVDSIYLTLDMDAISAAFAPGVSAPAALGLFPDQVLAIIQEVVETKKLASIDIAEVNPSFDLDDRTSKLAASFCYEVVNRMFLS